LLVTSSAFPFAFPAVQKASVFLSTGAGRSGEARRSPDVIGSGKNCNRTTVIPTRVDATFSPDAADWTVARPGAISSAVRGSGENFDFGRRRASRCMERESAAIPGGLFNLFNHTTSRPGEQSESSANFGKITATVAALWRLPVGTTAGLVGGGPECAAFDAADF